MGILTDYENADAVNAALNKGVAADGNIVELQNDINELKEDLTQLEIGKVDKSDTTGTLSPLAINGVTIKDGSDLSVLSVETKNGYTYAWNSGKGLVLAFRENENYISRKIPVTAGVYTFSETMSRFTVVVDDSDNVLVYKENSSSSITVPEGATYLYFSMANTAIPPLIAKGISFPKETEYIFSQLFVETGKEAIKRLYNPNNVLDSCTVVPNQYYFNKRYYNYEQYSVLIFNAEAGKTYQFGCEVRALSNNEGNIREYIHALETYTAETDQTLYCSVSNEYSSDWKIVETPNDIESINEYNVFSFNPNVIMQEKGTSKTKLMSQDAITKAINEVSSGNIGEKIYGKAYAQASGNLNSGDSLTVPKTNLKKNNVYSFLATITTMGTILIGHGKNTYSGNWIEINDTNVITHAYGATDTTRTHAHGLTISGYIYVQIIVKIGKADINIYSNGQTYTIADIDWSGDGNGDTFVESVGSVLTDCVFTWSSEDFRKSVWMFGDSYFGMTATNRWVSYLVNAGYGDNVLINAYAGENTTNATVALNNAIEHYGKPKYIVWCLGMNDGSDTDDSRPTTKWRDGINYVLSVCNEHGITPIFATIPTVPNINHEGKNNYIRNSGYRYIDFAKAVNAQSDGTWFSGMLSGDNVHPSETGARALYFRAIADCPEITFKNP